MAHAPRLAEPVAHDGHHAGPDGRLQEAVQHPQAAVQIDVVEVEPFGDGAKHKLLPTQRQPQLYSNTSYEYSALKTNVTWYLPLLDVEIKYINAIDDSSDYNSSHSPLQQSHTGRSRARSGGSLCPQWRRWDTGPVWTQQILINHPVSQPVTWLLFNLHHSIMKFRPLYSQCCCCQRPPSLNERKQRQWASLPGPTWRTVNACHRQPVLPISVAAVASLGSLLNTENRVLHSPPRTRRGRWSPGLPGTEWPAFRLRTDDCPPMSGTVGENAVNHVQLGFKCHRRIRFLTANLYDFLRVLNSFVGKNHYGSFHWITLLHLQSWLFQHWFYRNMSASVWQTDSTVLHHILLCPAGVQYLARGESVILDQWCPLGWDAHFHITECLPGRMQQHIAEETENGFTQQAKAAETSQRYISTINEERKGQSSYFSWTLV